MKTWKSGLRFTLRELTLLVVIVGLSLAWALDHQRLLQSPVRYSDNPLDLAIDGNGFFQLEDFETGAVTYTRQGRFGISSEDYLVLARDGVEWHVSPHICIPNDTHGILVRPDGSALVRQRNGSGEVITLVSVGCLQIAKFVDPSKLRVTAPAIYVATEESGPPEFANPGQDGAGFIRQGVIELANR